MIQNMSKNATLKVFKSSDIAKKFKNYVFGMINCSTVEAYLSLELEVDEILAEGTNFVNPEAKNTFCKYYQQDEWISFLDRWSGHITHYYRHFGCTTTQRAESGHGIVKNEMFSLQTLDLSFDTIRQNLLNFERGYKDIEIKEKTEVDVLVNRETRLRHLVGKISHFALVTLRCEVLRDPETHLLICECRSRVCYTISHALTLFNIV